MAKIISAALTGAVFIGAAALALDPAYDAAALFPLAAGNTWTYEGKMTVAKIGAYALVDLPLNVTMTVADEKRWGEVRLFTLEGHPDDAAWALDEATAEEGANIETSRYGFLCVANKVFRVYGDRMEDATIALSDAGYLEPTFLAEEGPVLEFPLFVGARFGATAQLPRADKAYFWYVADAAPYQGGRTEYHLTYYTNPDTTDVWFVPGVGITRYRYNHRGTPLMVDLKLLGATYKE